MLEMLTGHTGSTEGKVAGQNRQEEVSLDSKYGHPGTYTSWDTGERSREAAGQSGQSGDSRIYFQIRVSSLPSFQIYDQINEYHTYFSPREEYKIEVSQSDFATK